MASRLDDASIIDDAPVPGLNGRVLLLYVPQRWTEGANSRLIESEWVTIFERSDGGRVTGHYFGTDRDAAEADFAFRTKRGF